MERLPDNLNTHLSRLKDGDMESFKVIYDWYVPSLYSFVLRFVKSTAIADDIVQDTFVRIWEIRDSIDPSRSFKGYLYRIAKNLVLNLLSRARQESSILSEIIKSSGDFSSRTEDELDFNETSQVIMDGISKLPPQQRRVIELCKYRGLTYDQAANELNISSNTINAHMVSALRFLKQYLLLQESSKRADNLPKIHLNR